MRHRVGVSPLALSGASIVLATMALALACRGGSIGDAPRFIGSAACARCHGAAYAAWRRSQHSVAMQAASPRTVLADFDSTTFSSRAVAMTFLRRDSSYVVNAQGADGARRDFTVRYTFGVWPLQQYLVDYAGGRLQALSVAWDVRRGRWFSLQPDDIIEHGSAEHWTGRGYNWNYMCADCHSTAVRKGYDASADAYHTTRAEIGVGCESCHGPGSAHARWGGWPGLLRAIWRDDGLAAPLAERRDIRWQRGGGARTATRSAPRVTEREIETCAQCHARRVHIADGYTAGRRLLDYYIPALLTSDLYYPDGQQREEVYTYGSFLQSRMYAAGVTCSDCHDPHTGGVRRPGNALCTQCHDPAAYDTSAHHFHRPGSGGASCVACHMPDTVYMRIDPRHDHSLRVPRPDLSVRLGVPNACTRCHQDRTAAWAASRVREWYRTPSSGHQRFADAFAADDADHASALRLLLDVAADSLQPAIARGTALARLSVYRDDASYAAARGLARDAHPLVRLGALQVAESAPESVRMDIAVPMLRDERRALRQGAAWVLAAAATRLPDSARAAFASAAAEFVESQRYNADQPDDRLALGAFYAQLGRYDSAVVQYRAALRLEPGMTRASVYLAAVLRAQGRVEDAIRTLRAAAERAPRDYEVLLSLATYQLQTGDTARARASAQALARAYPDDARASRLLRALER